MLTKKYFSISEACDMCALAPHKLRYIDKNDEKISIVKIRGRRYYTLENINYLIKTYSHIDQQSATDNINRLAITNKQFLERIDQLIKNFQSLAKCLIVS